jgi:LysR family pca operon transcriptional activator
MKRQARTLLMALLYGLAMTSGLAGVAAPAAAASAGPKLEKTDLKFGFIKLTDCAPLIVAKEMNFFEDEGLFVTLEAQANWIELGPSGARCALHDESAAVDGGERADLFGDEHRVPQRQQEQAARRPVAPLHVGRAADQLAVTQPAVSKTLRELEDIVTARLFTRTPKGLVLTPFGELFQHHAGAGVLAVQHALESVAQGRTRGNTAIRVGALPTVAARMMPEAVQDLMQASPGATVSLLSAPNRFLLEALKGRDLDLVVGRLADPDQMVGLSFEQLYSERLAIVVRPDHPLLREQPFDIRRIARHPVVMPTREDITRPMVDRLLIANGVGAIERRVETVSSDFSRAFLKRTDAVWIISYGVVALDLAAGVLIELPADVSDTMGPVGMTTRADVRPSPVMALFMRATRAAAERVRQGSVPTAA